MARDEHFEQRAFVRHARDGYTAVQDLIKRQMYGRANFDLLRKRVLIAT